MRPSIIDTSVDEIARPRPGAAEPARRRTVGLAEGFEDRVLMLERDADASVGHRELQHPVLVAIGLAPDCHEHVTLLGELDGIADQVDEDLAQAQRIADERGRTRRDRLRTRSSSAFWSARTASGRNASSTTSASANGNRLESRRRDSIFEKSRMSLRISSSDRLMSAPSADSPAVRVSAVCRARAPSCR